MNQVLPVTKSAVHFEVNAIVKRSFASGRAMISKKDEEKSLNSMIDSENAKGHWKYLYPVGEDSTTQQPENLFQREDMKTELLPEEEVINMKV